MKRHHDKRTPILAVILLALAIAVIAAAAVLALRGGGESGEAVVALAADVTLVPPTTQPAEAEAVPSEAELLGATVPYRCFVGQTEWLTLVDGRANGAEGIGGVAVTATATGDLDGDGSLEVLIAMRESCGGESAAATVIVKSVAGLNERGVIATIPPAELRPIGEVTGMKVLPAYRLEVLGQINEFRFNGGRLEAFTAPTPPQQYVFDEGAFRTVGIR